jgi:threonine synthase
VAAEPRSFVTGLSCSRCERRSDADVASNLCACGSPLLVDLDLEAVGAAVRPRDLGDRPPTMWRYRELLPVADPRNVVSLGEGFTPLLPLPDRWGFGRLRAKDEGPNPTGTFKARGASCAVSRARELGLRTLALATAGNAGAAWACYGAAAGVQVHVWMPADAPEPNRVACELFGARVTSVDGLISDAAAEVAHAVQRHGWFDVSTLREPYRIEGKKTLGLEIAEQSGWHMPDAIVYPAGGGVGIIGIWRGLLQARALGWVDGELPRLHVVQAEGCAPIVAAYDAGAPESEPWPNATTVAAGLRVPKALGDFLVLRAIRETGGAAVAVSDGAILEMMGELARHAGMLAAPEGAAALAGAVALRERGDLGAGDDVVVILTGTGLGSTGLMRDIVAHGE